MAQKTDPENSGFSSLNSPLNALSNAIAIKRNSFNTISKNFIKAGLSHDYIKDLMSVNQAFGETVILHIGLLKDAKNDLQKQESIINQMYRHYVINTDGPIPEKPEELTAEDEIDHFKVFQEAKKYAGLINVELTKNGNDSILHFNEKKIPCPSWGVLPKKTAAYSLRKVGPVINKVRYGRNDVIPSDILGFVKDATSHSLKNAMTFADIAHLAYTEPGYIEKQLGDWQFKTFEWIEDKEIDTQSFLTTREDYIVVCFRGTASGRDWITDANLIRTRSFDGKGGVHRGFKKALDAVWHRIEKALHEFDRDKKIFFVGHSLGAALAQLAAYRQAIADLDRIAGVYVYGSPRIGNSRYKAAYDSLLSDKTFLHINNTDLVTKVPPAILGYRHMGKNQLKFDLKHNISSTFEIPPVESAEVESINQLNPDLQWKVREELRSADTSIRRATEFLNVNPEDLKDKAYDTDFDRGNLDEHGADQYLFKLGCAIVDREYQRILQQNTRSGCSCQYAGYAESSGLCSRDAQLTSQPAT